MKTTLTTLLALITLPILADSTFHFDALTLPLWDTSGHYEVSPDIITSGGDTINADYEIDVIHTAAGKILGTGNTTVDIEGSNVPGLYTAAGTVSRKYGTTSATVTIKVTGTGTIMGTYTSYNLITKYILAIDPASLTASGTAKGAAKAAALGSGKINSNYYTPLPADMHGNWTLTIAPIANGTKLTGTATATLSNGRTLDFILTGSTAGTSGTANLKLAGTGSGLGAKLVLKTNAALDTLLQIKGKVLGQTL